ncbi:OmpA family protein [Pseudaminobacter soli (ex Li et al. 2025)]|uniref:OmpA family protein n=1 Tax=Pseudaminobacter soli (ex Li et al. 2025) TaxID=1295366 RepID=UPI002476F8C2|nr:OmpA family protein [Mesorhizobium soli]
MQLRIHDVHQFPVEDTDGGARWDDIAGRQCHARYVPKNDDRLMSDLEIQENYRTQMRALGATVLNSDRNNTTAKLTKNGATTWFHIWSQETSIEVTVVQQQEADFVLTAPGPSDHRLLGHMPDYVAGPPERRSFDEATISIDGDDGDVRDIDVNGARFFVRYEAADRSKPASDADIHANYRMAVKKLGGEVLHSDHQWTYARFVHEGQVFWLKLFSQEADIELTVIEEKPFQASITPPRADELRTALDKDGRVSLHVNFDFAKATLKPDATPVIDQVLALLRTDPALRLSIEGHTDDIGSAGSNRKLSLQRAQSMVEALVTKGVAPERLKSAGFGADKALADNATSEGRARNRRVELVRF